ncbi:MAG TPA: precorrin-3B C(17)-methyltransferase [Sedimenticola sp.]|nr:precorrin-3B C(17)-methyltransferase [Sedimenticola sp.]
MNDKGKILLVGFGPGSEEQMTLRARAAIEEADVVIGYATYIKLVEHLLPGKEVVRKGMTEEIDRCMAAWEQARLGKTVALISSGDIGVYGMAGPTYEILLQSGWSPGSGIQVEVIPGSTALNAAASLVGAPLTHDFCAISLSDLLTPWPQIARRLQAAARGNFVIALYNPKSGRRTGQIIEAQRILLQYRAPSTPVAIVKSAYRQRQHIQRVRLDQMSQCDIGMLSTVLIGNADSYWREGLMITPRGYRNKYQDLTGDAHEGEQAGRSLSLGLEGWQNTLREHLLAHPRETLPEAASRFDVPLGAVLGALANRGDEEAPCRFRVRQAAAGKWSKLLESCKTWGPLRATVQNRNAVTARLALDGAELRADNDQLLLGNGSGRFQIDLAAVDAAWFVAQGEQQRGIQFVDRYGDSLFQLSQDGGDPALYQKTIQRFGR